MWNKTRASLVLSLVLLCFFCGALADGNGCNQRCNSKIDIVVVIDEDCEPDEYLQLKSFGYSFAQRFDIGPDTVHLGAVGYSQNSRVLFPLTDNYDGVQHGFDGWVQSNGHYSNVQSGIHGGSDCFKPYPKRQPDIEIIIIITKHNPNKCDNGNDASAAALQEANSCKSHPNRKIITIVVGDDCDADYYRGLSSPGGVFVVPSYCALSSLLVKLIDFICYRPPTLWIPPNYRAQCCGNCTKPPGSGQAKAFGYCHGCPPQLSYSDKIIEDHKANTFSRYIRRTWTACDECGNSKSQDQLIYLLDLDPPTLIVPEDKTFECCDNLYKYDFGCATASDNCDGTNLNITYEDSFVNETCPFYLQRVYSVYDSCGNQASGIQSITFTDTKPPVVITAHDFCITPDDNKKFCIYNLTKSDLIVAKDDCSDDVKIEFIEVVSECGSGRPPSRHPPPPSRTPVKKSCDPSTTPSKSTYQRSRHPSRKPYPSHSAQPSCDPSTTPSAKPSKSCEPSKPPRSRYPPRPSHSAEPSCDPSTTPSAKPSESCEPSKPPRSRYPPHPSRSAEPSCDPSTTPSKAPSKSCEPPAPSPSKSKEYHSSEGHSSKGDTSKGSNGNTSKGSNGNTANGSNRTHGSKSSSGNYGSNGNTANGSNGNTSKGSNGSSGDRNDGNSNGNTSKGSNGSSGDRNDGNSNGNYGSNGNTSKGSNGGSSGNRNDGNDSNNGNGSNGNTSRGSNGSSGNRNDGNDSNGNGSNGNTSKGSNGSSGNRNDGSDSNGNGSNGSNGNTSNGSGSSGNRNDGNDSNNGNGSGITRGSNGSSGNRNDGNDSNGNGSNGNGNNSKGSNGSGGNRNDGNDSNGNGSNGNGSNGNGSGRNSNGRPFRIRDLKSFDEDDEPLRDVGNNDYGGKCEYNHETDTLCIDSRPCHSGHDCTDRIHHIKFAVTDKCGNRRYQIVTVTVPAYPDDSRCKDCVSPR